MFAWWWIYLLLIESLVDLKVNVWIIKLN